MQSKQFIIDGVLIFVSNRSLKDKDIMFTPNSDIGFAFPNKKYLALENCNLFACKGLWNGISVNSNASLFLTNCIIEDANHAVRATTGSTINILNTNFKRNYIGIVLNGAVNVAQFTGNSFNDNYLLNAPGSYAPINLLGLAQKSPMTSYVGVFIENSNVKLTGKNNFGYPLQYGIVSNSSIVSLQDLRFRQIRTNAVFAKKSSLNATSLNFYNCSRCIDAYGCSNVNIANENKMEFSFNISEPLLETHLNTGIYIDEIPASANINISSNSIVATQLLTNLGTDKGTFHGVAIVNTGQNQPYTATIQGNSIQATVNGNAYFVNGILIKGAIPDNSTLQIVDNPKILVEGVGMASFAASPLPFTAIRLEALDPKVANSAFSNITIQNNGIQGFEEGYTEFVRGIFLYGGTTANPANAVKVKNNYFPNFGVSEDQYNHLTGIGVRNFENAVVCSNIVRECNNGIGLQGTAIDVDISGNSVEKYGIGLRYYNAFNIKQVRKNNIWISRNSTNSQDAEFYPTTSILGAQQSEFLMHTPQTTGLPSAYPLIVEPKEWFRESGSNILACGVKGVVIDRFESFRELANREIDNTIFTDATIWDMQYYLYARLKHDTELLSDPEIANFAAQSINNNIGLFHQSAEYLRITALENEEIRNEIVNILVHKNEKSEQLENLWAKINEQGEKADSLLVLEAVTLSEEIIGLEQSYLNRNTELAEASLPFLNKALILNEQISPEHDFEGYRKFATDCYIRKMINHEVEFDEKTISYLNFIAHLCPKIGGKAVYIARGVLPQSYLYDLNDESEDCYPDFTPSNQGKKMALPKQNYEVTLFPNPNDGRITLNFPNANVSNLSISNSLGMILYNTTISEDAYTFDLNLDLPVGLYHCVIQQKDSEIKALPFIVK